MLHPNRILIIAEAGVNHNGSLETAKALIEAAAESGADFVKFQTFRTEQLVSKEAPKAEYQVENSRDQDESQFEMIKKLELDVEIHQQLIAHAGHCGIRFLSTAFDLDSIDLLEQFGLPIHKVPSGEITNLPYLERIARTGKPVIVSTGMCDLADIELAIGVLLANGMQRNAITLLHCNTEYPTPLEDVNLRAMQTIAAAFKTKVGYSDHTLGIEVPIAAAAMGAACIEKHFTLDKTMDGPDHRASLEPDELKSMVAAVRMIEVALGDGIKRLSPSEQKNRAVARKSIHLSRDLQSGHVLVAGDLIMKRPGDGISPMLLDEVSGKRLKRDLAVESKLEFGDLE